MTAKTYVFETPALHDAHELIALIPTHMVATALREMKADAQLRVLTDAVSELQAIVNDLATRLVALEPEEVDG